MASSYKVADGHDIAFGSLNLIVPQPSSNGVEATRRTYSANGEPFDEGLFIELRWNIVGQSDRLNTILAFFGLNGDDMTNEVTISVPEGPILAYNKFNGLAIRPEIGRDIRRRDFALRELIILVKNLSYAA